MLVTAAELRPGVVADLRVDGGAVAEIGPALARRAGEEVLDAAGAAVLPGLHDHHVHLRAAAAAAASVDLAGLGDVGAVRAALGRADATLPPGVVIRAIGYHESSGPLDRATLDRCVPPGRPVRVQHRSGARWTLNSAALAAAGFDPAATVVDEPGVDLAGGHLWRRDDLVRGDATIDPALLRALGRAAAALGVTGFTDATPDGAPTSAAALARDLRAAGVPQRLHLMGPIDATAPDAPRAALGPVKVLLDDATLPPLPDLVATVDAAHRSGRPVAVHCVTPVQLVLTLTALADAATPAGPHLGDRVEHGSVIGPDLVGRLPALAVTVVTQPHFVAERGDDYRRDVEPSELASLYRVRSLLDAGVPVAAGTDAPFGALDPWSSMVAAVRRRTRDGLPLGAAEAVDAETARRLYLGHPEAPGTPRSLTVGAPADLCVLREPWRGLPDPAAGSPVRATVVAGAIVHLDG